MLEENFIQNKFGYCYYMIANKEAWVYNLHVWPEYRRQGRARKLLKNVIVEIRECGYEGKIFIEAIPDADIDVDKIKDFYESMGLTIYTGNSNG